MGNMALQLREHFLEIIFEKIFFRKLSANLCKDSQCPEKAPSKVETDLCLFVVVTCRQGLVVQGALECLGWAGGVDDVVRGVDALSKTSDHTRSKTLPKNVKKKLRRGRRLCPNFHFCPKT